MKIEKERFIFCNFVRNESKIQIFKDIVIVNFGKTITRTDFTVGVVKNLLIGQIKLKPFLLWPKILYLRKDFLFLIQVLPK